MRLHEIAELQNKQKEMFFFKTDDHDEWLWFSNVSFRNTSLRIVYPYEDEKGYSEIFYKPNLNDFIRDDWQIKDLWEINENFFNIGT